MNLRSLEDGKLIFNLESNHNLRQILLDKELPQERNIHVPIENNFYAPVALKFPPKMSPNTKYPLLVMFNGDLENQWVKSK